MRVLVAAGDGFDVHFVAADFLSQGGEVGSGGHDLQFVLGATRRRNGKSEDEQEGGCKCGEASVNFSVLHGVSK
jgi:hypothetical protein